MDLKEQFQKPTDLSKCCNTSYDHSHIYVCKGAGLTSDSCQFTWKSTRNIRTIVEAVKKLRKCETPEENVEINESTEQKLVRIKLTCDRQLHGIKCTISQHTAHCVTTSKLWQKQQLHPSQECSECLESALGSWNNPDKQLIHILYLLHT